MAGWSDFLGGIGKLLEKGATYLPGRVEKLKNERERLITERRQLIRGVSNAKTSHRVEWIDARVRTLEHLLRTKVSD